MTNPTPSTTGRLVSAVTEDIAGLVRQEVRQAQAELTEKAKGAGLGGALVAGAGVLGAVAVGATGAFVMRSLDRFLPRPASAFVTALLFGGAAGALAAAGAAELKKQLPLVPEQTVQSVKDDLRAAQAGA